MRWMRQSAAGALPPISNAPAGALPPIGSSPVPTPEGSDGAPADPFLLDHDPAHHSVSVINALSGLGPEMAERLCLVVPQPELECSEIHELGFADVWAGIPAQEDNDLAAAVMQRNVHGVLVISLGTDITAALECCQVVDRVAGTLPLVSIVVVPGERPDDDSEGSEVEMQRARSLFAAGADDVETLYDAEIACGFQIQVAFMRTEIMSRRACKIASREAGAQQKQMAKKLESTLQHRLLWDLPSTVLENIPAMDSSLDECFSLDSQVGEYRVTGRAVASSSHTLVRAEHPLHGDCALKIIAKQSVKSVHRLLGVNSEMGILQNFPPHPNVARAHSAFHGRATIITAINYCGDLSLQRYAFLTLNESTNGSFPPDVVASFSRQEAAAVAHLHSFLVCHRDLKPSSFIISNDGALLRLADFILSSMVCSPDQRFRNCCGSLPFVAPEVLRLQLQGASSRLPGYSGFKADVWSLAVNFVDLGCGIYAVERSLDWIPNLPSTVEQRLQGIERIPELWRRNATPEAFPLLDRMVRRMLTLAVPDRWCMERVTGRDGFGMAVESDSRDLAGWRRSVVPQTQLVENDLTEMVEVDINSQTIPEA
mmetsp:Transcript_59545/g.184771  ORF Transcript_59545/g.184771 Transcript_59545/m.184771 type:complete len:598 (+) Transcript_59545:87-1880(+)